MYLLYLCIAIICIGIGYASVQWIKQAFYEGLENNTRTETNIKRNIEFLNYLIVHSDPTPDNSGDYTSDVGVDMINQFIKTLPTDQRLHPKMTPYMDVMQHTIDTEENDELILSLKKLILDIHDKEQARLETAKLSEIAKETTENIPEDGM